MTRKSNGLVIVIIILLVIGFGGNIYAENIDLEYRDTDIKDVIRSLALVSDRNVVVDESAQGTVTVQLRDVSFEEAFRHLLRLKDLDYTEDGNLIVVAQTDRLNQLYELTEREIVELNYLRTGEVIEILAEIIPELSVRELPDQNRLILNGVVENLLEAEEIIAELDRPKKESYKIISIEYQDVESIVSEINDFFPGLNTRGRESVNDIIIQGRDNDVEAAAEMISELDRPDQEISRYYRAVDLSPEELLDEIRRTEDLNEITFEIEEDRIRVSGPSRQVNNTLDLLEEYDEVEPVLVSENIKIDYMPMDEMAEIIEELEPDMEYIKNESDRSIILKGEESEVKRISGLIDDLDSPRRQVMLEARIEEISHFELEEKGIDPDELRSLSTIGLRYDGSSPAGLDINLPELFSFFDRETSSQTLASPRLMTLDGEEASLVIGDQVPIQTDERVTDDGDRIPVYEYRDVGIILNFTPTITRNDTIILEMRPEVSSLGPGAADTFLPVIQTREIENNISLRDGQSFAIGGLIQDDYEEEIRKIPLLGDLPVIGNLFKNVSEEREKSEIIIFITTRIIDIYEDSDDEVDEIEDEEIDEDKKVEEDVVENRKLDKTVEEILEEIFATSEHKRDRSVDRPEINELKQIIFKARMERRDDWPEEYYYEFSSEIEFSITELADLYNVDTNEIDINREGNKFNYGINLKGNQVYKIDSDISVLELAENTGFSEEILRAVNQNERDIFEEGEIVVLPF